MSEQPGGDVDQLSQHRDDAGRDDAGRAGNDDSREELTDPRVSAAVERLNDLDGRAPAEHVAIYDEIHAALQDALAEAARVSQGPGSQASGANAVTGASATGATGGSGGPADGPVPHP